MTSKFVGFNHFIKGVPRGPLKIYSSLGSNIKLIMDMNVEPHGYALIGGDPYHTPPPQRRNNFNFDQRSVWPSATDCHAATGKEEQQTFGTLDCGRFSVNFVMDLLRSRGERMLVNEHGSLTKQEDLIAWMRTHGNDVPALTNTTFTWFSRNEATHPHDYLEEPMGDDYLPNFKSRGSPDGPPLALEDFLNKASTTQPIIMSITDTGPSNIEGHWVVVCGSRKDSAAIQELWVYDPLKGKTCWIKWTDFKEKLWPLNHDNWNCPEKAINVFP